MPLPYWIDALIFPHAPSLVTQLGPQHVVSYFFPQRVEAFFDEKDALGFQPFTASQIAFTRTALAYIGSLIDVRFVETAAADSPYTIALGNNSQAESAGYTSVLHGQGVSPLMMVNDPRLLYPERDGGASFFDVLLHELGHNLGLKHPFFNDRTGAHNVGPYLKAYEDTHKWTVMSYDSSQMSAPGVFGPLDIAALQYLYGQPAGGSMDDTRHTVSFGAPNIIWDSGGHDVLDASAVAWSMNLLLEPGELGGTQWPGGAVTAPGAISINFGTVIEDALGGPGWDKLRGNSANNLLDGGEGNNSLSGLAGNDILQAGSGYDRMDGGSGRDTVRYKVAMADCTVTRRFEGYEVTGPAVGTDTLTSIERIAFSDTVLSFDIDGIDGQVYRLYQAALNRKPDAQGLGFWIYTEAQGMGASEMALAFTRSAEFGSMYGTAASDAAYVALLYQNALHRPYDQGGFDYWTGVLANGGRREDLLLTFAESHENRAQLLGQLQDGFTYTPFG